MLYIAVVLYIRPSLSSIFTHSTLEHPPPSLFGGMHYLSTCNDTRFRDQYLALMCWGGQRIKKRMIVVSWWVRGTMRCALAMGK